MVSRPRLRSRRFEVREEALLARPTVIRHIIHESHLTRSARGRGGRAGRRVARRPRTLSKSAAASYGKGEVPEHLPTQSSSVFASRLYEVYAREKVLLGPSDDVTLTNGLNLTLSLNQVKQYVESKALARELIPTCAGGRSVPSTTSRSASKKIMRRPSTWTPQRPGLIYYRPWQCSRNWQGSADESSAQITRTQWRLLPRSSAHE